jgi:hypothetical protein
MKSPFFNIKTSLYLLIIKLYNKCEVIENVKQAQISAIHPLFLPVYPK